MKKLIAVLLTFAMLFTMFTSFGIVTTNAVEVATHDVEKIIWVQDFEKNMEADNSSTKWSSYNSPYFLGGRFAGAASGKAEFKDEDNNYLSVFPSSVKDAAQGTSVKVYLDNTKFEVGKKYKVAVDLELSLSSQAEEGETRIFRAYILSNSGTATLDEASGDTITYKDGGKGVLTTKVFEYTQAMKDVVDTNVNSTTYYGLNLRVGGSMYGKTADDKDKFFVDNVRIIEVTQPENVTPEGEGSAFDDYVLGSVMDFEDLSYNTLRHDSNTEGRDTDGNGIKYIVNDPTDPNNKVLRGPYVLDNVDVGNNSARTELIGLLANCNNTVGKTYTISFKMYPYGYSNVPITVRFKKNPDVASYVGMCDPVNLVEGEDYTPNQWNNIQFDLTTVDAEEINLSIHQCSINNGNAMDFDNYDYYQYIYIDDIKVTERVNNETWFTDDDIYNEENWVTESEDIFTVNTDKIEIAASEGAEELSYTFDGVRDSSMMITYSAAVADAAVVDDTGILPYISVCNSVGDELAISKLDNSTVNGTLIFNVPEDEENIGQFTDLTLNIVAGNVAAEITDFSLASIAAPFEINLSSTDDATIKVETDFNELSVPATTFTAVALSEGETVTNFTKDMIDLYPSATSDGASDMTIEIDMSDIDDYKSIFSVILYNEENSIYLDAGELEYKNPLFSNVVLGLIEAAGNADEIAEVIDTVEDDIIYEELLELDTLDAYISASENDDDLEIIYQYIYENKADATSIENLHKIVSKAYAFALIKNAQHSVSDFNSFVILNESYLELGNYAKYVADYDAYSEELFGSFLADIRLNEEITTFEQAMTSLEEMMYTTPSDLEIVTYFHDMEDGDFANLKPGFDYEEGGNASTSSIGVVKASDEGIADPSGNSEGHVLKIVASSSRRYKLTNVFNPTGVTPRDLGNVYSIEFDAYIVSGNFKSRILSVKDFNEDGSLYSNPSYGSKYNSSGKSDNSHTSLEKNEWHHISYEFTLDNLMTTSLAFEGATVYLDNIKVVIKEDNRRVIDSANLQPMDNTAALTMSGVEKTGEGFVFAEGGTLKYGVGSNDKQAQKYVADKNGYYVVTLVAKTNSDNALTLTANSSQVKKHSKYYSEPATTYPALLTYDVVDVDDFELKVGNNDVLISSGATVAPEGATVLNTDGALKTITYIFKDTGAKNAINYLGIESEILRSINITANEPGVVVESMTVKAYDLSSPLTNPDFESEFEGWDGSDVDETAFAISEGQLVITGSAENEGKQISQVVLMPAGNGQIKYTNVDNASSDAYIKVTDVEGNVLAKTKITPAEDVNTDKVVPFVVPGGEGENLAVVISVVAGSEGSNTIDNFAILTEDDESYVDLTPYPSFTGYFADLSSDLKLEILDSIFDENLVSAVEYIKAICDAVIDSRIENADGNYSVILDILANNADYLGLTNWSMVTNVSQKSYYSDVKEGIAKYVMENGYETLNDEIEDIIDDAKDSGGDGGSNDSSRPTPSLPTNVSSTTKPVVNPSVDFVDLHTAQWAEESIKTLASKGVVSGYADGTFKPNNEITRAEFAKMLVTAFGVADASAVTYNFADVNTTDWYYSYVAKLANLGVANGMGDGTFGANQKITRQDMVVLIVRMAQLLGKPINAITAEVTFNDNGDIASYASDAVKILQKAEIVSGFEDGTFRPDATATRAQVAKIIYALIG